MKEKYNKNVENEYEIGTNKSDGIISDETLEIVKQIDIEYNRKLYAKLVKLYGISNAKSIYLQMQKDGEEEIEYLKQASTSEFNIDSELNSGRSR